MGNTIVTILLAVLLVAAVYHIGKLRLRIKELEAELEARPAVVAERVEQVVQEVVEEKAVEEEERDDFVKWDKDDDAAFVKKLTDYVEAHISETSISADGMAAHMNVSRARLYRMMKNLVGGTPNDFVRDARIKKARHLLESHLSATEISISDIAYKCGYTDAKYFSRTFKAMVGKTPKEYREEMKKRDAH